MKKHAFFYASVCLMLLFSCTSSDENQYDSRAIDQLDKLSENIGEMSSLSYTLNTLLSRDGESDRTSVNDVYLRGPDKMFIHSNGDLKGKVSFWYDGSELSFFSYERNVYASAEAPNTIPKAIDHLHDKYDIDFPASDFLYPSLTDDILENYDNLYYHGIEQVDEIDCVTLEVLSDEQSVLIWIEEETSLPYKFIVHSKGASQYYYEATYSNWRVDPKLPDVMFKFQPPSNSTQINLEDRIK